MGAPCRHKTGPFMLVLTAGEQYVARALRWPMLPPLFHGDHLCPIRWWWCASAMTDRSFMLALVELAHRGRGTWNRPAMTDCFSFTPRMNGPYVFVLRRIRFLFRSSFFLVVSFNVRWYYWYSARIYTDTVAFLSNDKSYRVASFLLALPRRVYTVQ